MRYAGGMTGKQATPVAGAERAITFRQRELWAKMPTEEQILVYSRTLKMLQGPEVEGWDGEQALKALDRTLRIILAVVVNATDREWIEDLMLDGELTLVDACQILNDTVDAFTEEKKKAPAAPRKRAARRKVTPA